VAVLAARKMFVHRQVRLKQNSLHYVQRTLKDIRQCDGGVLLLLNRVVSKLIFITWLRALENFFFTIKRH